MINRLFTAFQPRVLPALALFAGIALLSGQLSCKKKRPFLDDPDGPREVEPTLTAQDPLLKLLPNSHTGLDFFNIIQESDQNNFYTNTNIYNGGGVAAADFNNDGLQDLYFISSDSTNKMYINQGNFKFKDVTASAGVASNEGFETTAVVIDINNDGWMDLYVCRGGMVAGDTRRNQLFVNNGNLTFTERAREYGIDDASATTGANFFDYDLDGDLDLYVLNQPTSGEYTNKLEAVPGPDGKMVPVLEPKADYDSDHFYRNDGGRFTDVSKAAGIWNSGYGLSVGVSDLNYDGYPDIYVANDFIRPDYYYINNRNGAFTDRLQESFRHTSRHSMGSDLTDFDNDCLVDLFTVDMLPMTNYRLKATRETMSQSAYTSNVQSGYYEPVVRNVLQRNNGNGTFSDVACLADVFKTEWSWSNLFFDIDNDGLRDLHITNGYRRNLNDNDFFEYKFDEITKLVDPFHLKSYFKDIHAFLRLIPTYKSRNCCYQNKGDWNFVEKSGDWLTMPASWSNGSVWADLDNDGDLDLVVNNLEDQPFVYQNLSSDKKQNNYLQLKLEGSAKNRNAIGASAIVYYGDQKQYLELNPVRGIFSSVEYLLHFGLGNAGQVDKLVVRWPDGKTQTLTNVPANQRLTLRYADASGYVKHLAPPRLEELYFQNITAATPLPYRHRENDFNDFEAWPLNLIKESDLGPFTATGDVNGDGLDDFFAGNAFDQPAALYVQAPGGQFRATNAALWEQEKIYEDQGAVFFDADNDGDQDLYVVSGGMEATSDLAWQDRLYRNDGKGNFSKAADALPVIKAVGMRVLAMDFDQDGDQDLIVGGRVSAAKWPLPPRTLVLQNDGKGHFSDVTAQVAAELEHCGMITGLGVANLDQTPAPELVVCGEWMPLKVFRYNGSRFEDVSAAFGLAQSGGLWGSLVCADVDGDGDQDLISGNFGLNSRLKSSAKEPLHVYASDFDGNGTLDPVVTYAEEGKNFPLVQKMVMNQQLPSLKKKFLLAQTYSRATVEDLFPKKLDGALALSAYTLETCWWENQGGRLVQRKLPIQAQTAPANAILFADFTGDGLPDILLAGNKYGLHVEVNRVDAGNGALLQGDGKGSFRFVENSQSGFWASREVRDLALLKGAGSSRSIVVANNNGPLQLYRVKRSAGALPQ
ncbi:MAG: VCBS repeat-containing protein [Saprospirales bacterium]|nr:VCBS repeat-containing protein [Saprospirales bacterium]